MRASLDEEMHPPCEHSFELVYQRQVVAEAAVVRHVHEQVDVAVVLFVAPQHRRTERANRPLTSPLPLTGERNMRRRES
jgi:hypothetical protein